MYQCRNLLLLLPPHLSFFFSFFGSSTFKLSVFLLVSSLVIRYSFIYFQEPEMIGGKENFLLVCGYDGISTSTSSFGSLLCLLILAADSARLISSAMYHDITELIAIELSQNRREQNRTVSRAPQST